EHVLCRQATIAGICSAPDRTAIGDFPNLKIVGNGVDLARFPFVPNGEGNSGCNIVFVGNLGYFPNIDAASWFALEVMPLLIADVPAARIKLVGARPARKLRRIAAHMSCVDLVGPVPAVHPFLIEAAVAVAPLRAGSGQQLKILEAMAAGTPVVATSLAAAGLDAIDNEHLLVADDAKSMVAAITRLLADRELGGRLAHNARVLVETNYSWERSALDMESLWIAAACTNGIATQTQLSGGGSIMRPARNSASSEVT
ncbi:MAG: glycosyltransferase family 4 protein, partial [Pseudomonadota bacterium]